MTPTARHGDVPPTRAGLRALAALAILVGACQGTTVTAKCAPGTMLLTVEDMPADTHQLVLHLTVGGVAHDEPVTLWPNDTSTTSIEIDFKDGYRAGAPWMLSVDAENLVGGVIATTSTDQGTLLDGCTAALLTFATADAGVDLPDQSQPVDESAPDLSDASVLPAFDGSVGVGEAGMASTDGSVTPGCASLHVASNAKLIASKAWLPTGDFTMEAWIDLDSYGLQLLVLYASNDDEYSLQLGSGGAPFVDVTSGTTGNTVSATTAVPIGGWHHVAGVVSLQTGRATVFLDGKQVASGVTDLFAFDTPTGTPRLTLVEDLGGDVSSIRISNGALYTTSFTPPPKLAYDAATTACLYDFTGGAQASYADQGGWCGAAMSSGTVSTAFTCPQ